MAVIGKGDLAQQIADQSGLSVSQSTRVLGEIVDSISEALQRGDSVRLTGFGTFRVVETGERRGRHPRTGGEMTIPAGKRVAFTPGSGLKDSVQGQPGEGQPAEQRRAA